MVHVLGLGKLRRKGAFGCHEEIAMELHWADGREWKVALGIKRSRVSQLIEIVEHQRTGRRGNGDGSYNW
jgi:hypothetical protein